MSIESSSGRYMVRVMLSLKPLVFENAASKKRVWADKMLRWAMSETSSSPAMRVTISPISLKWF